MKIEVDASMGPNGEFSSCSFMLMGDDKSITYLTPEQVLEYSRDGETSYAYALAAMMTGKKVKLPEWVGYWFMEDNKVKVFTRDCKVIDTPYFESYVKRLDWSITDGSRDFGGALLAMKAGRRVRRKEWGEKVYIVHVTKEWMGQDEQMFNWIGLMDKDGNFGPWTITHSAALAEDWVVID